MSYWEDMKKQPSYKEWKAFLDGSGLCACDHGCNQWTAKNAHKILRIIEALEKRVSEKRLDQLAKIDCDLYTKHAFQMMWRERPKKK